MLALVAPARSPKIDGHVPQSSNGAGALRLPDCSRASRLSLKEIGWNSSEVTVQNPDVSSTFQAEAAQPLTRADCFYRRDPEKT
jgi:hypothetical protein